MLTEKDLKALLLNVSVCDMFILKTIKIILILSHRII